MIAEAGSGASETKIQILFYICFYTSIRDLWRCVNTDSSIRFKQLAPPCFLMLWSGLSYYCDRGSRFFAFLL